MPLVTNSLGGGHACTHTNVHTETIIRNRAWASRRPAHIWFKNQLHTKLLL